MNVFKQANAELTRLGGLIENMSVVMLTNIHRDGALVSRPMSPLEMDADGVVWFFVDSTTTSNARLKVVNLSFSDGASGTYVSISGRGELDGDRERMHRLWTTSAKPWFPQGPSSPDLALLKVVPNAAEYWDAPHSRMVRMLAMAASVATGEPLMTGDHDTLTDLADASSDLPADTMEEQRDPAWDKSSKLSSTVDTD